jgi:DNA repair exonuclease SbcCD nuclease subunit
MHISDTHLGAIQYGFPEREQDFYDTFKEGIKIALDKEVDFIIHSGDLFDSARPSNRALRIVEESMVELQKNHIPLFAIAGDHDRPKIRDNPSHILYDLFGMRILGLENFESDIFKKGDEAVFIGGVSNMKSFRRDQLANEYNKASSEAKNHKISVFISHQAISPIFLPENSEAREEDLPVNYNYLAFGHIHQYIKKKIGRSLFSYAGSTEVKSTNEIRGLTRQGKGVNIVETDGDETTLERISLTMVRPQIEINGTIDDCLMELDKLVNNTYEKKPVVSLFIKGKPNTNYLREKMKEYGEVFIMRQPIIMGESESMEIEPSFEENIEDIFNSYFTNEKNGKIALEIYQLIKDRKYTTEDIINLCREATHDN